VEAEAPAPAGADAEALLEADVEGGKNRRGGTRTGTWRGVGNIGGGNAGGAGTRTGSREDEGTGLGAVDGVGNIGGGNAGGCGTRIDSRAEPNGLGSLSADAAERKSAVGSTAASGEGWAASEGAGPVGAAEAAVRASFSKTRFAARATMDGSGVDDEGAAEGDEGAADEGAADEGAADG